MVRHLWAPSVRLMVALGLLLLGVGDRAAGQALPGTPAAGGTPAPEVREWLGAFERAWSSGDVAAVLAYFATDAVIEIGPGGHDGPIYGGAEDSESYRGPDGVASLRTGVQALLGVQLKLAQVQAMPVAFGRAPATRLRWAYAGPPGLRLTPAIQGAPLPSLPAEEGSDLVVIRQEQIVSYSRIVDPRARAARAQALQTVMAEVATRTARATAVSESGVLDRTPETQWRSTPTAGPWIAAAVLSLLGALGLAASKRPPPRR
ncbi:MAG TPA: hypothetical protein VHK63_07975 [Candidatus Limnocylindria bacterium]|nr:hypothetical protein [Candidatus Limnocylindria bacterium]